VACSRGGVPGDNYIDRRTVTESGNTQFALFMGVTSSGIVAVEEETTSRTGAVEPSATPTRQTR
jgi:hypothetical protein